MRTQLEKDDVAKANIDCFHHLEEVLVRKGMGTIASSHEALGIIQEEVQELIKGIEENHFENIKHELKDIAAICVFTVACMNKDTLDWPKPRGLGGKKGFK